MSGVTFNLDRKGGSDILRRNVGMQNLLNRGMNSILSDIEAQFFQTFGVEGRFELSGFTTDRSTVKISAADKNTGAILRQNPKWLAQFVDNIKI